MQSGEVQLSWRAHPARERRSAALAGALGVLGVAAAVGLATASLAWALLALALLLLSLNRFFLPSRFELDQQGITARFPLRTQHLDWRQLRRFVADSNGGYLSTRARGSWLDPWRGMHVLFGERREEVLEAIGSRVRRRAA